MTALLDRVGRTPLVELTAGFPELPAGCRLFGKLESLNPGGSVKDRPVARILAHAKAQGLLGGGRRVLDSSSGNSGIAYAMLGAAMGIPITIVVSAAASRERLDRIAAHGAELVLTDPTRGYDFAIATVRRMAEEQPDTYLWTDQYGNPQNVAAHYEGTGVEIVEQMKAQVGDVPDAFVNGVGTGGTLTGVGRRLRAENPALRIHAVIPDKFPGIEGLKCLGGPDDVVPPILDTTLMDRVVTVPTAIAWDYCRRLARLGYFLGTSSGAHVHTAIALAHEFGCRRIVTLLCDTGERYVSTGMWSRQG